jgi:hypothetical protein
MQTTTVTLTVTAVASANFSLSTSPTSLTITRSPTERRRSGSLPRTVSLAASPFQRADWPAASPLRSVQTCDRQKHVDIDGQQHSDDRNDDRDDYRCFGFTPSHDDDQSQGSSLTSVDSAVPISCSRVKAPPSRTRGTRKYPLRRQSPQLAARFSCHFRSGEFIWCL